MAKAIKKIHKIELTEEEKRSRDIREIEDALLKHKETILDSLQVIQHMHDRGVISLLNGLFGQGDKVLKVLVDAIDTPENTNAMKNGLLLLGSIGMINVKQLEPFLLKLNAGIARMGKSSEKEEKTSYLNMVRSLKDPEVNRAITMLLNFLKGMGSDDTEDLERNTVQPPHKRRTTGKTLE